TSLNAYSLTSRDLIAAHFDWSIQETVYFAVTEDFGGVGTSYGPFGYDLGRGFPEYRSFKHALHQGVTYTEGQDATGWAFRRYAADLAPPVSGPYNIPEQDAFRDRNLELRGSVGTAANLDGRTALPVRLEGCMDFPDQWDALPDIVILHQVIPEPSRACFEYTEWITADSPYPVRIDGTFNFTSPAEGAVQRAEMLLDLVEYEAGTSVIPWQQGTPASPYRSTNPMAEHAPDSTFHPTDGSGHGLGFPLSAALGTVSSSAGLPSYQLWRGSHPQAKLAGTTLEAFGTDLEGRRWTLIWSDPVGMSFVVYVERARPSGGATASEVGEIASPKFDPQDLPAGPITLSTAHAMWLRFGLANDSVAPNSFGWGFGYQPNSVYCRQAPSCGPDDAHVGGGDFSDLFYGFSTDDAGLGRADLDVGLATVGDIAPQPSGGESWITLDARTGAVLSANDYGHLFDATPKIPSALETEPPAAPKASGDRPAIVYRPDLRNSAALTIGLLAIVLVSYFWPLIKGAAAHFLLFVPGYAKTEKPHLFEHKTRETIADAIRQDPGITAPKLHSLTGASWSTVIYHLRILERNGLVSSLVEGRYRHYFPTDTVHASSRGRMAALQNQRTKEMYELLLDVPGLDRKDLASRIGISRPATYWHLERLERTGLVGRDRDGRRTLFFAVESPPEKPVYDPKTAVEVA
ncbi:MAG TPA: winged helix-turn-helix transcriptional regulator, partial [Candidatus Thermoplasmatota archaeon]